MPPNKRGAMLSGQVPASKMFIRAVRDVKRTDPTSLQLIRSRICWGRIPSGPPADPAGKERIARIISPSVVWNASELGGRSGDPDESSAGGCLVRSSSKDSASASIGRSLEQRILTAARMLPSSSLDDTARAILSVSDHLA